jgi:hypothetical protein
MPTEASAFESRFRLKGTPIPGVGVAGPDDSVRMPTGASASRFPFNLINCSGKGPGTDAGFVATKPPGRLAIAFVCTFTFLIEKPIQT